MLYFLLHDANAFHGRISPALALSWRQRSFRPIVELANDLGPALTKFAEQFHLTGDEAPLLAELTSSRPFDRRLWRHVAGEILLYAAGDAPTIQTAAETLTLLVTHDQREIIQQSHTGSCDLDFDGVPYRPGHAGLNDLTNVIRLADELAGIDSTGWSESDLDDDESTEELAFGRDCVAALRDLYQQARQRNQVVVCEDI